MDQVLAVLGQLGLGVASNAVYDLLRRAASGGVPSDRLAAEIDACITMHGVSVSATTVITALAERGFLSIRGSDLYASQAIVFGSVQGRATAADNTTLRTDKTAVQIGAGAAIHTTGNAQIRQHPDGSITFHVGGPEPKK